MRNLLLIVFFLPLVAFAGPGKSSKGTDLWDQLLKKYVTPGGLVDYTAFKADNNFKKCLDLLASELPTEKWSREEQMAHWINVYNAFTVKLITDHYPVASIKDLDDPWKQEFIVLAGKKFSLDHIEHEILRKQFNEPRIHFALNCAAYSCPVLPNYAIRADKLDKQLDHLTREFLNDIHRNRISGKLAQISQIFEWFADDFKAEGGVRVFIEKHRGIIDPNVELSFIQYDWKLNGKQ